MTAQADALMGIFGFKRVEKEMKTDRELLGLAAKAAGFSTWDFLAGEEGNLMNVYTDDGTHSTWWPLEDDGDALRLAIDLNLQIRTSAKCDFSSAGYAVNEIRMDYVHENHGVDKHGSVRRAIVRAAAAIGEQMS